MKISVIIPVYKNKDLLLKNFTKNFPYLKECEIIMVDDCPEDRAIDVIKEKQIIKIYNKKNLGFAGTVNKGVKQASGDLVFLLNSDVILKDSSFKGAINEFERNEKLFTLGCAQIEHDGSIVGKNEIYFKDGLFMHRRSETQTKGATGWAEGGSSIYRKSFYNKLGGMDTVYAPFYWEDVDLSTRAIKKGWDVIFDPERVVEHHHASTIGKYFENEFREVISYRNQFLFTWRHANVAQRLSNVLNLPKLLIQSLKGDKKLLKGFLFALVKVPHLFL